MAISQARQTHKRIRPLQRTFVEPLGLHEWTNAFIPEEVSMSRKGKTERKRRKRANAAEKKKRRAESLKSYVARFPDVIYLPGDAPERFVNRVKDGMHRVVASHRTFLSEPMCDAFYRAKVEGFPAVIADIQCPGYAARAKSLAAF